MLKPSPPRCHRPVLFALILSPALWLTACAPSTDALKPSLAETPPGLATCTDAQVTPLPGAAGTPWDTPTVVGIIGDQRSDALAKDKCAHNWRSFYEDLRKGLAS